MKEISIRSIILVALPILLALSCVFCAVFGVCMALKQSDDPAENADPKPDDPTPEEPTPEDPLPPGDDPDPGIKDPPSDDPPSDDPPSDDPPDDPVQDKKYVAFTFDDGPAYQSGLTQKYVDELAKYGGEATFFLVGDRINATTARGLVYAVEHGWELGIHAYTHKYYFNSSCSESLYQSEVKKTADAIHKYLPEYEIKLLRPPGGTLPDERVKASPYAIILWNVDSNDWKNKNASTDEERDECVENIVYEVMTTVKDGSIILMHDIYNNSYLAFCEIIKQLSEQGYEFVTVSELLGEDFETGKKFYSGK